METNWTPSLNWIPVSKSSPNTLKCATDVGDYEVSPQILSPGIPWVWQVSFDGYIRHESEGFISREKAIEAAEADWLGHHIVKMAEDSGLWPVRKQEKIDPKGKQGQADTRAKQRQNFNDLVNILTEATHNGH